jgi:hypothetical protein
MYKVFPSYLPDVEKFVEVLIYTVKIVPFLTSILPSHHCFCYELFPISLQKGVNIIYQDLHLLYLVT